MIPRYAPALAGLLACAPLAYRGDSEEARCYTGIAGDTAHPPASIAQWHAASPRPPTQEPK